MIDLTGKFFISNSKDGESFRTGEVIGPVILPSSYLVQYDSMNSNGASKWPMEIVPVSEMIESCDGCGQRRWGFFDTREKLQAFIDWIDAPPEPTKIRMIKNDKSKH